MKALVFRGPGNCAWQDVPDPGIDDPAEAIVRVDVVTVCGTDLHILKSDVPDPTDGLGADVVMEAVGVPEAFEMCTRMVRPGGRVASIGVHGNLAVLHLEDLWIKDTTITTGLVDTSSIPVLLSTMEMGRLPSSSLITHRYELGRMEEAYDVFGRAADTGALKVALGAQ
ncbi:zinc-binding dehydrogenase [Streptomyces sp. NBC_00654]|uniref:zinc-binding dehydrogenase n=1 Tax=Streptomyces sp. NBC_00654 TaxID=2975799 RepID=UPI0022500E36|nr:zinc-binding dehydrogenase [Streptomyces sp. NBC_00654]MCX4966103.1 zinc-binding dehydrogenase [Streptomyces sp. NBC_00654]